MSNSSRTLSLGSITLKRACILALGIGVLALPALAIASDSTTGVPDIGFDTQRHHRDQDYDPSDYGTEARQRFPFFVSIGAYFPTFTGDGTSNNPGAELAFGYRFATDNFDFRISGRGQEYNITDSFGNQSTIDVSMLSFDALFRAQQFYGGPGISFGSVTGTTQGFTFSGQNETVFSLTAGYDISQRVFVEARWQTADVDAYKGWSINVGLHF